jgi:hypothetical protein
MSFQVYVLQNPSGRFYIGQTDNLDHPRTAQPPREISSFGMLRPADRGTRAAIQELLGEQQENILCDAHWHEGLYFTSIIAESCGLTRR